MAKGRRLTQSRSIQAFKPFSIKRSKEDTLPSYIKGAALFDEVDGEEGLVRARIVLLSLGEDKLYSAQLT